MHFSLLQIHPAENLKIFLYLISKYNTADFEKVIVSTEAATEIILPKFTCIYHRPQKIVSHVGFLLLSYNPGTTMHFHRSQVTPD